MTKDTKKVAMIALFLWLFWPKNTTSNVVVNGVNTSTTFLGPGTYTMTNKDTTIPVAIIQVTSPSVFNQMIADGWEVHGFDANFADTFSVDSMT